MLIPMEISQAAFLPIFFETRIHRGRKATPVKKPLMVLATLPRMVSPAETVSLPVNVFSMDEKVKDVSVEVKTNDLFTVAEPATQRITFDDEGDQLVYFTLKVARNIGAGKVEVIARSGNQEAKDIIDLLLGTQSQEGKNTKSEKKSLDAFAILNLPARLRKTAVELLRVGSASAAIIARNTGEKEDVERENLEELFELGFLHLDEHNDTVFFSIH